MTHNPQGAGNVNYQYQSATTGPAAIRGGPLLTLPADLTCPKWFTYNQSNQVANAIAYQGGTTSDGWKSNAGTLVSPLDEVAKGLDAAQTNIAAATTRVRAIADNLFGSLPEPKESGNSAPQRIGRIGSLNDQADRINGWLTELDAQLNRLAPLA
jgi:hypothetical protein